MKNFREHFVKFRTKLEKQEHFAFSRYSDGEMYILQNKELVLGNGVIQIGDEKQGGVYQQPDFKHFDPNEHSFYQQKSLHEHDLLKAGARAQTREQKNNNKKRNV